MSNVATAPGPSGPVSLAAHGDATDVRVQSGMPFHLLEEARRQGLALHALPLRPTASARYRVQRALWNARRVLAGGRRGGYTYTAACQEREWDPVRDRCSGMNLLRHYQLMAPSLVDECAPRTCFYIDMTLRQLFGSGYETRPLGEVATSALALEKRGYQAARAVIAWSSWAARSVIADYDVPADRVHIVLPGANLDHAAYQRWERAEAPRRNSGGPRAHRREPVRLVFVGYDWRRKGLDRFLRAHALARRRGSTAVLRVIGCPPRSLPAALRSTPGVEWCGVIDKRTAAATYLRLLAECDVGCLLSRHEAAGLSLREYGALGLASLATTVGGSPEMAPAGASVPVDPGADHEAIAEILLRLAGDHDWRESLRAAAWERRHDCLWAAAVERLAPLVEMARAPVGVRP